MLNKYEQSIVNRLRYASHNNHSVTLGADEVHIPMNAMEGFDAYRSTNLTPSDIADLKAENEYLKLRLESELA